VPAELALGRVDQRGDRGDGRRIVVARRGHAPAQPDRAVAIECGDLDLGAAEIDAEAPLKVHARSRGLASSDDAADPRAFRMPRMRTAGHRIHGEMLRRSKGPLAMRGRCSL